VQSYEQLGSFYLGKICDPDTQLTNDNPLLYDAKDLTTHAVCIGMTGSGKTGLCLSLLEEAAIDGIPTIAIDPKGDIANLLLTFPDLQGADFEPWVDEGVAIRAGMTRQQFAAEQARLWSSGLSDWGQDGSRIARFRDSVDIALYTPGSNAGLKLKVLQSFAVPGPELLADPDAFSDKIANSVSALLALLDLDNDPIRSREHILLSSILSHAWQQGRDLTLEGLIAEVQKPAFDRVGVMSLETFFPAAQRGQLAMQINGLLASPGFATWMQGEPLDISRLFWTPQGQPRISILSVAHLSDRERMFFVTCLLNELVAWMRTQPGTGSLRALLYMDEVFGFFPPTANPPSKKPMMTLLKQARAFGLGVTLATQNPVDLDYKGLSNMGTWFIGRLQTERDRERLLEGLAGASGSGFDRQTLSRMLASLGKRVFLMNNVHEDAPVLFKTRWVLSYLRGPLTINQVRVLCKDRKEASAGTAALDSTQTAAETECGVEMPLIPDGIPSKFLPAAVLGQLKRPVYRPALLASARLHYVNATAKIDVWKETTRLAPIVKDRAVDPWEQSQSLELALLDCDADPTPGFSFEPPPGHVLESKSYTEWKKRLIAYLYRNETLTLWKCQRLKLASKVGESERDFRARLALVARERRDLAIEKLRKRYAPKVARATERIHRAEAKIGKEQEQYRDRKLQTAISVGATVLGALFGRKLTTAGTIGRATTAARGVGRATRERGDVARAKEQLEAEQSKLEMLEEQLEDDIVSLREHHDPELLEITERHIRPRKADISVTRIALAWSPYGVGDDQVATPLFELPS
jgi:hypothetical protein